MIFSPDGSTKDIMTYEVCFLQQQADLKREGRYRTFTELERRAGWFPRATRYVEQARDEVIVWCSNDYVGMGQHPKVLTAMHEAIERCGAGAGGTRNTTGSTRYHLLLERELADPRGTEATLLFNSVYMAH